MADDEARWQAVVGRDRAADGTFFYAVRSTGVYCRPTCAARRPRRDQVRFYASPAEAEVAGFRPCKRCHPRDPMAGDPKQAELVRRICAYVDEHADESVTLEVLGKTFHMSPTHLQKLFRRRLGLTPRQYADGRRLERFKAELRAGEDVTRAQNEAGYSSSSRVYERAPGSLGMTPGAYRRGGAAQAIHFNIVPCALGRLLVAATERGICAIRLGDEDEGLLAELAAEFPLATLGTAGPELTAWTTAVLEHLEGRNREQDLPLDLRATAFQWQVWQALRSIPLGRTRSYQEVARQLGRPSASRAVARACATNPVAVVIPCHRVVRTDGGLGGYRWGIERKERLLASEASQAEQV